MSVAKSARKTLTYEIPEAGAMAGLNRNQSYIAATQGFIPSFGVGEKRRKVPAALWDKILAEGRPLTAEAAPTAPKIRSR